MVFAATGLGHDEAVAIANESFGGIAIKSDFTRDPAVYTGGDLRIHSADPSDGLSHIALALGTRTLCSYLYDILFHIRHNFLLYCVFCLFVCLFVCLCLLNKIKKTQ